MKCKFKFASGKVEWIEVGHPPPTHFIVPILPPPCLDFEKFSLTVAKHEQIQTRTFNRVALWTPWVGWGPDYHDVDYEYVEQPRARCDDCGTDEQFLHQWKAGCEHLCLDCHEKRIEAELEARRTYL